MREMFGGDENTMKARYAAQKLSFHLMQCGMLMPMEWIRENGDGSELQEAFMMAIDSLNKKAEEEEGGRENG